MPHTVRLGKKRIHHVGEGFDFVSKMNTFCRHRTKEYIDHIRQGEKEEKLALVRSRKASLQQQAEARRLRDQQEMQRKKDEAAKLKESLRDLARENARKRGFDLDNFSYKRNMTLNVDMSDILNN